LQSGGNMAYRYFIKLAYNGKRFGGWQKQPNADTVQRWIENALSAIAHVKNGITGCGRTDAGVHASVFYAHFDHETAFSKEKLESLVFRLNGFLPDDIVVYEIIPVFPGTHARYSALSRQYEYLIIKKKDPFCYENAYFIPRNLDLVSMNYTSKLLLGTHDFQCFTKVKTQVNSFVCDVQFASWSEQDQFLKFTIRADRFLRNMVRAIVGTLLDVGYGKLTSEDFRKIIESHNRSEAGFSVPAKGLILTDVVYPDKLFSDSPIYYTEGSEIKTISHYYSDQADQ
jgi:tRNA pseudouridine38-40 synthase